MPESLWARADLVTPMAIRVAATLRLADHITAGVHSPAALAAEVGADPDTLGRLMAHLVTAGVLTPSFELTELGKQLRDDHPGQTRALLDTQGAIGRAELSLVQLLQTVRTGEAAYPHQYGQDFWHDVAADPVLLGTFHESMRGRIRHDADEIASAYPWNSLGHVVDVGGGSGSLLIAVLTAHGDLRGTVLDLPGPAARASAALATAGLAERASVRVGDFFDELPPDAGGYLLSAVIHDWSDSQATQILRRCATAAGANGKVIVIEDNRSKSTLTAQDLRMLSYLGGRERTTDQIHALARLAGLKATYLTTTSRRQIIEYQTSP